MPVAQKVGPDGCLYVLDWYDRYHCYQDANRDPEGIDRLKGRLYRVRYGDSPRAPRFDLASGGDEDLIRRLASPNIYFRETAQRLLTERNTPAIRDRLRALIMDDSAPRKARMHGLWALIGAGGLEPEFHARLLDHADPAYRAWGVRAAGDDRRVAPALRSAIARMARDGSPDVQLQVAIAARKVEGLDPLPILVEVLSSCGEDRLIPTIAWSNLHPLLPDQGDRFVRLIERVDLRAAPALAKLLPRVVDRILGEPDSDLEPVRAIIERLAKRDAGLAQECLSAASDRAREMSEARRGELRAQLRPVVQQILAGNPDSPLSFGAQTPRRPAGDGDVRRRCRPRSVHLGGSARGRPPAGPGCPHRVQGPRAARCGRPGALRRLAGLPHPRPCGAGAIGRSRRSARSCWRSTRGWTRELQPLAVDLLLQREPWARKLLDAVLAKRLPRSTLDANHLRKILESNDREAIWAVEKAWGTVREERDPRREQVVAEMGEYLRRHPGDPKAGRAVFKKLCGQCHTIYGEGESLGPDLTSNGRGSFDQLLASVFDPSLVIGQSYQTTTVVTEGGRNLTGLVAEDNDRRIVLAMPGGGKEVVPRNDVKYTRTSKLSMMPEGIETILGRRELADLFAFLALDRPPDDPQARPIPGAPEMPSRGSFER